MITIQQARVDVPLMCRQHRPTKRALVQLKVLTVKGRTVQVATYACGHTKSWSFGKVPTDQEIQKENEYIERRLYGPYGATR